MLTKQQSEASVMISNWFRSSNPLVKQTFVLSGFAGTGKTYLIRHVVKEMLKLNPSDVVFITPTGKAATVLIQKDLENVMTLHKLIYSPTVTEKSEIINGEIVTTKKLTFSKKENIGSYKLIVLDEVSMVDDDTMEDLLSYNIKVLCSGDMGQLPPIYKNNNLLLNPDYILTEVVRQAEDNTIVKIATMIRNKEHVDYGNYGDVVVADINKVSEDVLQKILLMSDQVICGKNSTRRDLNNYMRESKGIDIEAFKYPLEGEKVICQSNNWEMTLDINGKYNLVNGTIGYLTEDSVIGGEHIGKMKFRADYLKDDISTEVIFDSKIFEDNDYKYDVMDRAYKLKSGGYSPKSRIRIRMKDETREDYIARMKKDVISSIESNGDEIINRFEFGYAISCHKSQGSEFDRVVVIDESLTFGQDSYKWLYTAVTRAKKKLVILRNFK